MNSIRKNVLIIDFILIITLIAILICIISLQAEIKDSRKHFEKLEFQDYEENVQNDEDTTKEVETILDWAETVERTEPTITIWNHNTKIGSILQDGQEYTLKDGDAIVICFDEQKNLKLSLGFGVACEVGKGKCFYTMIVREEIEEPKKIEFCLTGDDVEYKRSLYILTETEKTQ